MSTSERLTDDPLSPQGILEVTTAFMKSRVLLTAYELGLFTLIEKGVRSSAEAARSLGTDPRATDRLLNALCAIGLSNPPRLNRELIRKGVNALNPSGQLVVQDFIMDEDRVGPPSVRSSRSTCWWVRKPAIRTRNPRFERGWSGRD